MDIIYNNKSIKKHKFLKVNETQNKPEIKLNVDKLKKYVLVIYDPDAVGGTHIHWVISDIKNNNIKLGKDIIEYKGPAPPPKSGKHRYIFELYEQKNDNYRAIKNRVMPIEKIRIMLNLDKPLLKYKFISENDFDRKTRQTRNKKSKKSRKTKRRY